MDVTISGASNNNNNNNNNDRGIPYNQSGDIQRGHSTVFIPTNRTMLGHR